MARIKGFAIRGLLKSVKERATFDRAIVASEWYPYAAFVGLVRAVDRIQGKGDLVHARDLGRAAAARDLPPTACAGKQAPA